MLPVRSQLRVGLTSAGAGALVLEVLASDKAKQGPLDKHFLLTLARKFLPRYLSAQVASELPKALPTSPQPTALATVLPETPQQLGRQCVQRKDEALPSYLHCFATLEVSSDALGSNMIRAVSFVVISVPV